MASNSRLYVVHLDGKPVALVRAANVSQAVRHVTEPRYEAVVADQDHLTSEWGRGATIEDATAEATT
jgi:hypothetical protein